MSAAIVQQRCWNHEAREAVCRCPECGRSFCRECVTEHEARLLCANCLQSLGGRARRRRGRTVGAAFLALAGIFLAWLLFFSAGEAMILMVQRVEQRAWQSR
jgi:hypothetical protein